VSPLQKGSGEGNEWIGENNDKYLPKSLRQEILNIAAQVYRIACESTSNFAPEEHDSTNPTHRTTRYDA
jgi:hypothetical protein